MYESGIELEEMIDDGGGKEDDVGEGKGKRMLMEVVVKDRIVKGCLG